MRTGPAAHPLTDRPLGERLAGRAVIRLVKLREASMKALVLTLALLFGAGTADAQTRPSTVSRPCAASQRDVQANGAIVLGTGGYTFDRFVRDRSFCQIDEGLDPAFVPSRDNQSCFIGYRCKTQSRWFDD